jgi:2-dehydropantoate 2-reductase
MKSQHTLAALEALRTTAGESIPLICCQNGVANERMAARRFDRVYAMKVFLPASHIEPGVVLHEAISCGGILDAGCFPNGTDNFIRSVVHDIEAAGFSAVADERVMRWKYAKLLSNLGNTLQVVTKISDTSRPITHKMKHEALQCYAAAGIECADRDEIAQRHGDLIHLGKITGHERAGSSSWQSLLRGTGNIETDYLNGEIVQLGRLYNIATPANQCVQQLGNMVVQSGMEPGSVPVADVLARIDAMSS